MLVDSSHDSLTSTDENESKKTSASNCIEAELLQLLRDTNKSNEDAEIFNNAKTASKGGDHALRRPSHDHRGCSLGTSPSTAAEDQNGDGCSGDRDRKHISNGSDTLGSLDADGDDATSHSDNEHAINEYFSSGQGSGTDVGVDDEEPFDHLEPAKQTHRPRRSSRSDQHAMCPRRSSRDVMVDRHSVRRSTEERGSQSRSRNSLDGREHTRSSSGARRSASSRHLLSSRSDHRDDPRGMRRAQSSRNLMTSSQHRYFDEYGDSPPHSSDRRKAFQQTSRTESRRSSCSSRRLSNSHHGHSCNEDRHNSRLLTGSERRMSSRTLTSTSDHRQKNRRSSRGGSSSSRSLIISGEQNGRPRNGFSSCHRDREITRCQSSRHLSSSSSGRDIYEHRRSSRNLMSSSSDHYGYERRKSSRSLTFCGNGSLDRKQSSRDLSVIYKDDDDDVENIIRRSSLDLASSGQRQQRREDRGRSSSIGRRAHDSQSHQHVERRRSSSLGGRPNLRCENTRRRFSKGVTPSERISISGDRDNQAVGLSRNNEAEWAGLHHNDEDNCRRRPSRTPSHGSRRSSQSENHLRRHCDTMTRRSSSSGGVERRERRGRNIFQPYDGVKKPQVKRAERSPSLASQSSLESMSATEPSRVSGHSFASSCSLESIPDTELVQDGGASSADQELGGSAGSFAEDWTDSNHLESTSIGKEDIIGTKDPNGSAAASDCFECKNEGTGGIVNSTTQKPAQETEMKGQESDSGHDFDFSKTNSSPVHQRGREEMPETSNVFENVSVKSQAYQFERMESQRFLPSQGGSDDISCHGHSSLPSSLPGIRPANACKEIVPSSATVCRAMTRQPSVGRISTDTYEKIFGRKETYVPGTDAAINGEKGAPSETMMRRKVAIAQDNDAILSTYFPRKARALVTMNEQKFKRAKDSETDEDKDGKATNSTEESFLQTASIAVLDKRDVSDVFSSCHKMIKEDEQGQHPEDDSVDGDQDILALLLGESQESLQELSDDKIPRSTKITGRTGAERIGVDLSESTDCFPREELSETSGGNEEQKTERLGPSSTGKGKQPLNRSPERLHGNEESQDGNHAPISLLVKSGNKSKNKKKQGRNKAISSQNNFPSAYQRQVSNRNLLVRHQQASHRNLFLAEYESQFTAAQQIREAEAKLRLVQEQGQSERNALRAAMEERRREMEMAIRQQVQERQNKKNEQEQLLMSEAAQLLQEELAKEQVELQREIAALEHQIPKLQQANASLEETNASVATMQKGLTAFVEEKTAKNLKLESSFKKMKDIYNGLVALQYETPTKDIYRNGMYRVAQRVVLGSDAALVKMAMEAIQACEKDCGSTPLDLATFEVGKLKKTKQTEIVGSSVDIAGGTAIDCAEEVDMDVEDMQEYANDMQAYADTMLQQVSKAIDRDQCSMLLAMFKLLDKDRNGSIDKEEFGLGVKMLNRRMPSDSRIDDPDRLFQMLDADGNGTLDLEEFEALHSKM
jgi:EF-hand domain pair